MMNRFTGEIINVTSGNYKVYNPDNTYYTFVAWEKDNTPQETTIGQYGTYNITSDSTLTEHIIKHILSPNMNDKNSSLRYEMIDKNNILIKWQVDNQNWVAERWSRLALTSPLQNKDKPLNKRGQTTTL
ncbi:DUF4488 domain-containing protein [Echinicola sp. CAU 1574]|uniref:DUF4488 domain-containing protein n=2 Tax=Echinicola arenosa TaxID=2774144 RepID=A0ABR9AG63_9BACT|nr:DUF4488 domain-containing protein [Echinicola arenosa]